MKDKRLPQIVIFAVLAAICLGYVVYRLVGTKSTQAAPPPAQVSTTPQQTPTVEPTPVTPSVEAIGPMSNANKRDPFAPAFSTTAPEPQTQVAVVPPASRISSHIGPINGPLPVNNSLFGTELEPISRGSEGTGTSQIPTQPSFPDFRLTGILRGPTNVAIIRSGDRERHIVREGDYINGRFKVVAIGPTSVIIDSGKESRELKLGGDRNAT